MWNLKLDYTVDLARQFLLDDFLKVIRRTKYLYVEFTPPSHIGYGYFEPIVLSLCWCDFLGALYCGNGKLGTSAERSKTFIGEVLGQFNSGYKSAAEHLVKTYRNGAVHAYAPDGNFNIILNEKNGHLTQKQNPDCLVVSVNALLDDMEKSVNWYADNIHKTNGSSGPGTLTAFNQARRDLLHYVEKET